MSTDQPILLSRNCRAAMIPSGEKVVLPAGSRVWLTQSLGGTFTVLTERGYSVRIEGEDGDALGLGGSSATAPASADSASAGGSVEDRIWRQLRCCYDPEIPVNIVELGLVYDCRVEPLSGGGYHVSVRFTLTSPGCGMGQFLKEDIKKKLLAVAEVREATVELVWEPPWNQSMISPAAKHQLGIA